MIEPVIEEGSGVEEGRDPEEPADEATTGPEDDAEMSRPYRIPRSFAVAAKEVTAGQYREFLRANPQVHSPNLLRDLQADQPVA